MHSSPRILTRLGRLAAVGILGARALSAQLSVPDAEYVLHRIESIVQSTDYRAMQVRRVRGHFSGLGRHGEWVGAVESILHRGATATQPDRFSIELRGIEGRTMGALELAQRQQLYRGQVDYLFRFQSFRVHDAGRAARQYTVHDLGPGPRRAQRSSNRIAVVSRTADRPSWLLDLDAATGFPLYSGEFTPVGSLVGEVEVTSIAFGAAAGIPIEDTWAWTPRLGVEVFSTVEEASRRASTVQSVAVSTTDVGGGYAFTQARVTIDPITAAQTVVQVFQDGIDSLFVTQRPCVETKSVGHTARFYEDAGVFQCLFQQRTTEFLVVGRNSNLRAVTTRIHRRAVETL